MHTNTHADSTAAPPPSDHFRGRAEEDVLHAYRPCEVSSSSAFLVKLDQPGHAALSLLLPPPPPFRFAAPSHRMRSIFKQPISFNKLLSLRFLSHLSVSSPERLKNPAVIQRLNVVHEVAFPGCQLKAPYSDLSFIILPRLQWSILTRLIIQKTL